jgi:O-methyltransferase involved in polyketide biosynthesis
LVLGAGLDTFAYRSYPGSRLRVFEVDHPATQVWKRDRLQEAGIAIPELLTFAAIDFEKQTFADGLRQAGYAIPPAALGEQDRSRHDEAARVVATRGEPWLTYFEPATLAGELRGIGW